MHSILSHCLHSYINGQVDESMVHNQSILAAGDKPTSNVSTHPVAEPVYKGNGKNPDFVYFGLRKLDQKTADCLISYWCDADWAIQKLERTTSRSHFDRACSYHNLPRLALQDLEFVELLEMVRQ
jgi:hypothetical protein